jgi:hypothetical protein
LGRTGRGWINNIKMNLREIEYGDKGWTDLAVDKTGVGL